MKNALIIFVKNLVHGKVKTRLAAGLGDEKAFGIYQVLVEHTANVSRQVAADKYVYFSDHVESETTWKDDFLKKIQNGKDLGEKMLNAFEDVFKNKYQKAVIIGSDCFEINSDHIHKAFEKLNKADVVIGPAADGGYYLLGLKKLYPALFNNIQWSTHLVLRQTMDVCRKEKLSVGLLEELHDIDEEKDWLHFKNGRKRLLFVYNANGDMFNAVTGYAHKMFSPSTYACRLCTLTHGNFGIRKQWKNFIDELPFEKVFFHKDDFVHKYPDHKETGFPAVFIQTGISVSEILTAAEINSFESLRELQQALLNKLNLHDQHHYSNI